MCDRIISDDIFSLRYLPDQYKTQQMCDKVVDDFLAALKSVSNWLVTSKMIKILFTALCADKNILYFNEESSNLVFICNGMGILNIDLNSLIILSFTMLTIIKMILILLYLLNFSLPY